MSKKITNIKIAPSLENEENDEVIFDERDFIIKSAQVKDGYCIYSYQPLKGIGKGDLINVKGAAIVHEDMREAMSKLKIHLAIIDDAFKKQIGKKKDLDISVLDAEVEVIELYHTTGIKIKGNEDDEKVIILGSKYVSVGGHIDFETPAMHLTVSNYKWYNDLRTAVDGFRKEVEEYMHGKCTPVDDEEPVVDKKQMKIEFSSVPAENGSQENGTEQNDDDFEKAKV